MAWCVCDVRVCAYALSARDRLSKFIFPTLRSSVLPCRMQIINDYITRLFVHICSLCGRFAYTKSFFFLQSFFFRVKSNAPNRRTTIILACCLFKTYFLFYLVRLSLIFSRHLPERGFRCSFTCVRVCGVQWWKINSCASTMTKHWGFFFFVFYFFWISIYLFSIRCRLEIQREPDMCSYTALTNESTTFRDYSTNEKSVHHEHERDKNRNEMIFRKAKRSKCCLIFSCAALYPKQTSSVRRPVLNLSIDKQNYWFWKKNSSREDEYQVLNLTVDASACFLASFNHNGVTLIRSSNKFLKLLSVYIRLFSFSNLPPILCWVFFLSFFDCR